jgi:quercetin dioxygenase-like cupin family protein
MQDYVKMMNAGKIVTLEQETPTAQLGWNAHPTFKGVSLKHLVTGQATEGKLSCHLVHIQAGCEIGTHVHAGKLELHEVLSGQGQGLLVEQTIPYLPGTVVVIPADQPHRVVAGDQDVYLLAKFTPALV